MVALPKSARRADFRRRVRGSDLFLAAGAARRMVLRCCCRCRGEKMEVWWFCSGGVKCAGIEAAVARRCCDVAREGVVDERCS
ncbi:hypothetical protein DEO72_LG3g1095 [Vigna unguiculata]|uniref:Uncharacterized protein n=1 Tax=Vigna unguiculata TaxID=3917 RepID=A0A4D6LD92_VIGUN|nr:hypothetical protein DEO72_LG3g1095 [Vigna unguiculata]